MQQPDLSIAISHLKLNQEQSTSSFSSSEIIASEGQTEQQVPADSQDSHHLPLKSQDDQHIIRFPIHSTKEDSSSPQPTQANNVSQILVPKAETATPKDTSTYTEEPIQRPQKEEYPNDWILGILLLSFIIFLITRFFYHKHLNNIRKAAFTRTISQRIFQDQNLISRRTWFFLNVIFVINSSLFIYEVLSFYNVPMGTNWHPAVWILLFSSGITIVYFSKYLACHITGILFDRHSLFAEYIHIVLLYNKNIGIYLFPVIIALPYIPGHLKSPVILLGMGIWAWFFLWRIIQSLQLVFQKNVSVFYLILYLCTLEILPILIIYRLLSSFI